MAPSQPALEAGTTLAPASSSTGTSTNRTQISNPLLEQALQKYIESLQPEERAAFEDCTAEEVMAESWSPAGWHWSGLVAHER